MSGFRDWLAEYTPFMESKNSINEHYEIRDIPLDEITGNPYQPRTHINEEPLQELVQSIDQYGVINPIQVTPTSDSPGGAQYQLIAGERRVRACRELGRESIPAVIRELSDEEIIEVSFLENLQREDMNPVDKATMYSRLRNEFKNISLQELSDLIGKSEEEIKKYEWILELPSLVQQAISKELIGLDTARKLRSLEPDQQKKFISFLVEEEPDDELIEEKIESLKKSSSESDSENDPNEDESSMESDIGIPKEIQERNL